MAAVEERFRTGATTSSFPSTMTQRPLFRLLGTPEADKKHVLFESGHVPPYAEVVRETLDWLDRYLGPVTTGPPGP